jgi:endonuclease/exonuclease/phosphatase family metal-dependent hydrolase
MKKGKIIAVALAAAIALTGVGFVVFNKDRDIDFGEIIIDGIPEKSSEAVRIMSFNVRCRDDKAGSVHNRSKIVTAIIDQYAPDSFGVQEATGKWMDILSENLGEKYAFVGEARDESGYDSELSAVFYLKDKYNLIDEGTIWLSETPEVKYTKSFDSACHRVASWAVLENKETGERYTHLNTHLDHVLEETRTAQIGVFIDKLTELQKDGNVVCTGDFNTEPTSEAYAKMLQVTNDTQSVAETTDSGLTFHNYGTIAEGTSGPIDYIFAPKDVKVENYKIIRNTAKDMYPSDHYPIIADIVM